MDSNLINTTVDLLKTTLRQRAEKAKELEHEDAGLAYERWKFYDLPFVNELCLMLLVAVWHQVEREVVNMAARVTQDGKMISREQFLTNLREERERFRKHKTKKEVIEKLELESFDEWRSSMKTLNTLANCYKHDPSKEPDKELISRLNLDPSC